MENVNVTEVGEEFGQAVHRSLRVSHCENGFIVEYETVPETKQDWTSTLKRKRVFTDPAGMIDFVGHYFCLPSV